VNKKRVGAATFLIIGGTLLYWRGYAPDILENTRQTISLAAYQFLVAQSKLVEPFKRWLHNRRTARELEQQLAETTALCQELQAENIRLQGTLTHAHKTQELCAFAERYKKSEMRVAQVLARCFSDASHYFLIDAGSAHGVEPDMAVTHNNSLVGKISEVYHWYSKVCLISDHTCKVAVYGSKNHSYGIHEGCNRETETALCYVDHLQPLEQNELLISSGDGLVFPEGFGIGHIKTTETGPLHHDVTVTPLCNLRAIRYCTVFAKGELKS